MRCDRYKSTLVVGENRGTLSSPNLQFESDLESDLNGRFLPLPVTKREAKMSADGFMDLSVKEKLRSRRSAKGGGSMPTRKG
ncbi:hypothetical protein evm_005436 [Chilo suppressalis]|nr:hypothetical protein evm_005436 [Chilo suppressalis]